jgi:plastocyanin
MPGSTVSWTNEDSTEHTVTADGGNGVPLFDSCPVPPGMLWESTFDSVRTFGYHCLIYPWMRGSIMVG